MEIARCHADNARVTHASGDAKAVERLHQLDEELAPHASVVAGLRSREPPSRLRGSQLP